jgi:nucleolar complex protein 3
LPPPLPNADRVDDDASEGQLSDDDLALFQASNGAQFNFLRDLPTQALDLEASQPRKANKGRVPAAQHAQHATLQRSDAAESEDEDVDTDASGEDEEGEAWEKGPRKAPAAAALASKLKAGPLPIKTLTGDVVAPGKSSSSGRKERGEEDVDEDALLAAPVVAARNLQIAGVTLHDDLEDALKRKQLKQVEMERQKRELQKHRAAEEHREPDEGKNDVLRSLKTYDSAEARRQEAKKTMATAAQALLADPEGQVSKQLRILLALLHDRDAVVCRLAMLSLLAVFRDVIPGYRIRPVEEKEQEGVAVSKEVRKLWEFESALLKGYQSYLKGLLEVGC